MVVDAEVVDPLSDLFESFLAQAVTTENAGEDEFYEVAFPGTPSWQKVRVTALFKQGVAIQDIAEFAQSRLHHWGQAEVPFQVSELQDQQWERVWLSHFEPLDVGANMWIVPSWLEPPVETARNICIDPGLAFGTGTHATTLMCLSWLAEQDLRGQKVMDYGSGTGILAIAALAAGAISAEAIDIDPLAVAACNENAQRNQHLIQGIEQRLNSALPGDAPQPTNQYGLVIANILAEVIIDLSQLLKNYCQPNGVLLLTGILDEQADRVIDQFKEEFDFQVQHKDHWVLLVGKRS